MSYTIPYSTAFRCTDYCDLSAPEKKWVDDNGKRVSEKGIKTALCLVRRIDKKKKRATGVPFLMMFREKVKGEMFRTTHKDHWREPHRVVPNFHHIKVIKEW